MLNSAHEILFLVARDFVQLTPIQKMNIAIRLHLCGVEIATLPADDMGQMIFKMAYQRGKIPDLVKEMRPLLYE